jgi:hypothetical protein
MSPLERLEQYTAKRRQEVLVVTARVNGAMDEILVFKGFSSSLMAPTAFDPDVAVLPETSEIVAIARLQAPYNPQHPQYLDQGLTWESVQILLLEAGV